VDGPSGTKQRGGVRAPLTQHPNDLEINMKNNTPKAHSVSTIKERLTQPTKDKDSGKLQTAQGFAVA